MRVLKASPQACVVMHTEQWIAALSDDPHYVKALQRRAASNEKIGTWSALSSAQEGLVQG